MERNNLYPVFLKTEQINILIIGAGNVGEEKLSFMLKSSPYANVEVVSETFSIAVKKLAEKHAVKLKKETFHPSHLNDRTMVISATNNRKTNEAIYAICKERNVLINVADNPDLCDFYLGGIVTKENLKIAISTNGKSPTLAKRFRQVLEQELPETTGELLNNLHRFRKTLKGSFAERVNQLNELTKTIINN